MEGLRVKALVADCDIAGKTREVRFASAEGRGDLIIKGLTVEEAMMILRAASGERPVEPSKTIAATPKPAPALAVVAEPEPAPAEPELAHVDEPEPSAEGDPLPTTPAEAKAHPAESQPEPEPSNGKGNGEVDEADEIIAKLQGHKRILHIVNVLVEHGYKTSEQVLAKCQEVRAHVPALERITPSDFDERIKRVYEVLDAGAAG